MIFSNEKKIIILFISLFIAFFLTAVIMPDSSTAQDIAPPADNAPPESDLSENIDGEAPAFSNPAQANHAENLAYDAATRDERTIEAMNNLAKAEQDLKIAEKTGDATQIEVARLQYESAEKAAEDSFSEITGVLRSDISAMRDDGMGWGQIAHELGVHPGVLGLGHSKHPAGQEINAAKNRHEATISHQYGDITARNMKTGWSDIHDKALKNSGGKVHGHDRADGRNTPANAKGAKSSNGHGRDGKSGNNGKGRSK